jgi:hypothetical protein
MPKKSLSGPSEQNPQRYKRVRQKKSRKGKRREENTAHNIRPIRQSGTQANLPPTTPACASFAFLLLQRLHFSLLLYACVLLLPLHPLFFVFILLVDVPSTPSPCPRSLTPLSRVCYFFFTYRLSILYRCIIISPSIIFSSYPASSTSPIVTMLSINGFSPTSIYASLL